MESVQYWLLSGKPYATSTGAHQHMSKDSDADYVKSITKLFCSGNCLLEYCSREAEEFGYIYVVLS